MCFSERKLLIINPTITTLIVHQDHVSVGVLLAPPPPLSETGPLPSLVGYYFSLYC